MKKTRENFGERARRIIALRAAYQCSFPNCGRLTVGPGVRDDQVENTGVAAHIYSAADKGPRGKGNLSPAELKSPSNGIWTCGVHSGLIDKNTGLRYRAGTLLSWKALHEFRVAQEHSGRAITYGAVRQLRVTRSPLFKGEAIVRLAKSTFIVGQNGSGKTALCQWLSSVDSPRHLARWRAQKAPLTFEIEFDAPHKRLLRVDITDEVPSLTLDNNAVAFNQVPITSVLLGYNSNNEYIDDLDRLGNAFMLDPTSVKSLATFIAPDSIFLSKAKFNRERNDSGELVEVLYCTLHDGHTLPFNSLSSSEQGRALLDFAVAQVRNASLFRPALLMIEFNGLSLGWDTFQRYLEMFASPTSNFQTIVTTHTLPDDVAQLGWQIYGIRGDQPGEHEVFHSEDGTRTSS